MVFKALNQNTTSIAVKKVDMTGMNGDDAMKVLQEVDKLKELEKSDQIIKLIDTGKLKKAMGKRLYVLSKNSAKKI